MSLRSRLILQQGTIVSDDKPYLHHKESKGIYNMDEARVLYPIDPATRLPMTDLGRLTNPGLTQVEKERVMSHLKDIKGSYLPEGLTDDEIMSLVPPRYFTDDQVDIQAWRDYLGKEVLPEMDAKAKNALADEVQPAETAEEDNV